MASGRAPRIGRKRPPIIPGPRISNKSSLPLDNDLADMYIRTPYTAIRKMFPRTEVVHGKNP